MGRVGQGSGKGLDALSGAYRSKAFPLYGTLRLPKGAAGCHYPAFRIALRALEASFADNTHYVK
jgi:hypothetical protein